MDGTTSGFRGTDHLEIKPRGVAGILKVTCLSVCAEDYTPAHAQQLFAADVSMLFTQPLSNRLGFGQLQILIGLPIWVS